MNKQIAEYIVYLTCLSAYLSEILSESDEGKRFLSNALELTDKFVVIHQDKLVEIAEERLDTFPQYQVYKQ